MALKITEGQCRRPFVLPLSGTEMMDDIGLSLSVTHTHTHMHMCAQVGFVTQSFAQELASRRKMGGGRQSPILLSLHSVLHNIGRKTVEYYQVLICLPHLLLLLLLLLVWILVVVDGYAL